MLRYLCVLTVCFIAFLAALPKANPEALLPVDLELVIAADMSDSMDIDELTLQRQGFVAAFRDKLVISAIAGGHFGRIAVSYVEWGDAGLARVVVPWTVIDGERASLEFAHALDLAPIIVMQKTSISAALQFASHLIENNAIAGERRVIDISGDGPNNQGGPVSAARDAVVAKGIIINGLPIQFQRDTDRNSLARTFGNAFDVRQLHLYFEECVIGGPGAFYLSIKSLPEMVDGIRSKLIAEIAGLTPVFIPVAWRPQRFSC